MGALINIGKLTPPSPISNICALPGFLINDSVIGFLDAPHVNAQPPTPHAPP